MTQATHASYADPITYVIWWHYVLTETTSSATTDSTADAYMKLTLVDLCYPNVPTISSETDDINFVITAAGGDSAVDGVINTAATTVTGCTITKTMEIYDDDTDDWVLFVHSGTSVPNASYPWIDSQDSATGDIGIIAVTEANFSDLRETVYNLRWKNMDLRSKADGNIVYDYFDVKITFECHDNTVVIGNTLEGIIDFDYELTTSSTVITKTASYTELYSTTCPTAVTMSCEYMADDAFTNGSQLDSDNWVAVGAEITTCDTATGFVVDKDNTGPGMGGNNLPEQYVNYRIKYTVPDSLLTEAEGKIAYDYFTVRFHTPCADLTITVADMDDVTYLVKSTNSAAVSYSPSFTLTNGSSATCTVAHTYKIREAGTATWYDFTDTSPHDFSAFIDDSGTDDDSEAVEVLSTVVATFNPALVFEVKITYADAFATA